MPVDVDPDRPLDVYIDFQSVHAIAYRLRSKRAGSDTWEEFARGTHRDEDKKNSVGPLSEGSMLDYRFLYFGTAGSKFRAVITIKQDGKTVEGGTIPVEGPTEDDGVGATEDEVTLT